MTEQWKSTSARFGWLAGAVGAAVLTFSLLTLNEGLDAQPAKPRQAVTPAVSFADVIEAVSPAVVNIAVTKVETASTFSLPRGPQQFESPFDFFQRFFEGDPRQFQRRSEGQGSGFLIDPAGYIVTNNHVAGDADKITVTLQDGRKFEAELVGKDARTDLALLKINDDRKFPYVELGDSDKARVGDWVVAIGNPFGLGGTATAGIISARGRDDVRVNEWSYIDYLQLDAPINFGNSGGPVFNTAGEVIGVNTAIFTPNGGNVGIGFAIPSNQVKAIVSQLRETGTVERGYLGVNIQSLDEDLAKSLGLDKAQGALVAQVVEGGPAAKAGVQAGDVITHFNGQAVRNATALSRAVAAEAPKQTARLTIWRDGRSRELTVELGEAPNESVAAASGGPGAQNGASAAGLTLQALTPQDRTRLDLPSDLEGVLVTRVAPNSPAAEKGIRSGDVITRINRRPVTSVADAVAALNAARDENGTALLLVRRGDSQQFVALNFR
jgi:serine protease Do